MGHSQAACKPRGCRTSPEIWRGGFWATYYFRSLLCNLCVFFVPALLDIRHLNGSTTALRRCHQVVLVDAESFLKTSSSSELFSVHFNVRVFHSGFLLMISRTLRGLVYRTQLLGYGHALSVECRAGFMDPRGQDHHNAFVKPKVQGRKGW